MNFVFLRTIGVFCRYLKQLFTRMEAVGLAEL